MKNKRLLIILSVVGVLLLVPLVAMQFSNEVNWTIFDFVVAGGLLLATALGIEAVLRKVKHTDTRVALCAAIVVTLLIVWAELAVGIFGSPLAGN